MKVTLISNTRAPIYTICMAIDIMKEKDPLKMTHSAPERYRMIDEILKSRLRGALEFASFEFLLEGVSRTFTHQLVRHRTFHFSQQSMRFFDASESKFINPLNKNNVDYVTLQGCANVSINNYRSFSKNKRIPIQDARSILPQNIETKIMFGCTYRSLIDLAEVRMCWQSQGEFRAVMDAIVKIITEQVSYYLGSQLKAVCDRTGRCEFQSIYDRPCPRLQGLKTGREGGEKNGESKEKKG